MIDERLLMPLIIRKTGRAIYGEHWVIKLAGRFNMTKRRMQRLMSGRELVHDPRKFVQELLALCRATMSGAHDTYNAAVTDALDERNRVANEVGAIEAMLRGQG